MTEVESSSPTFEAKSVHPSCASANRWTTLLHPTRSLVAERPLLVEINFSMVRRRRCLVSDHFLLDRAIVLLEPPFAFMQDYMSVPRSTPPPQTATAS